MDWACMLSWAFKSMRLKPHEFWALTPAEIMMMLGDGVIQTPISRARLDELQNIFPDHFSFSEDNF